MRAKRKLKEEERNFFELVHKAGITNPFSDIRSGLDRKLSLLPADYTNLPQREAAINNSRSRIKQLEKEGRDNLNDYEGRDREILKSSFVWDFYHSLTKDFDQHIRDQFQAGYSPVKVNFAGEGLSCLIRKGFNNNEAVRYFALNFQIRRAYYFIFHNLVGRCPCMKKLRESLWNNIFTCNIQLYDTHLWNRMDDFATIILGETGAGKGTAAMAIGRSGFIPFEENKQCFAESFMQSFVALNLSQFQESLIESELFGHKKGAFTGAIEHHKGIFYRCSKHGAIFLDEIGEVSVPLQIKLLKVLEERAYSPVGSHETRRFQGRIIAATNRSLEEIIEKGIMRKDFFYRLCSDIIIVPPLRQRIKENPDELNELLYIIIHKMLGTLAQEDFLYLVEEIRSLVVAQLGIDYPWPGNVRELEQCVRRILLNRNYTSLNKHVDSQSHRLTQEVINGNIDAQNLIRRYCTILYQQHGTYGEVARRTGLDWRTVKNHVKKGK